MTDQQNQSLSISINMFTAVEGGFDALLAFQIAEMQDMSAEATAHGWLGNEAYRSDDDTSLMSSLVSDPQRPGRVGRRRIASDDTSKVSSH